MCCFPSESIDLKPTYMLGPTLRVLQVIIERPQHIDLSQVSRECSRALHHLE